MNIDVLYMISIAGVICLASMIQSSVGFASALFATPLLLWIGMPLPNTITTVAVCSFLQAVLGARYFRASVPWKLSLIATVIRVSMIIVGLQVLKILIGLDISIIKLVVGCILCALVIIQVINKTRFLETVHWFWSGLAFGTSGLLAGICGMGGPPLVIWSLAHNWPTEKVRGFLFSVFAASIPIQIMLMYVTFGTDILWASVTALLFAPAVFLGTAIGLPLGNRIPKHVLCRIVHLILLALGLSSIIPAVI